MRVMCCEAYIMANMPIDPRQPLSLTLTHADLHQNGSISRGVAFPVRAQRSCARVPLEFEIDVDRKTESVGNGGPLFFKSSTQILYASECVATGQATSIEDTDDSQDGLVVDVRQDGHVIATLLSTSSNLAIPLRRSHRCAQRTRYASAATSTFC